MTDQPDVRQVLVHPAVWPHLELWLASRNLLLARVPVEDDLPTYAMVLAAPGDAEKVIRDAARQAAGQPAGCVCGHREDPGVDHRTDGPCTIAAEEPQDHPAAELYVLLRKAGEDRDTAQQLIHAHAAMAVRQHEALNGTTTPAAGQPDTQQQTQLTATDRAFLNWALDQAAHVMASDGAQFDNDGHASMARLRRVADEAAQ